MPKKNPKTIPQRSPAAGPAATSAVWTKLYATVQAAVPVLAEQAVVWNETEVLALRDALPPEAQERFATVIERNLCGLGSAMHKAMAQAKERETQAAEQLRKAEELAATTGQARAETDTLAAQLDDGKRALEAQLTQIAAREQAVASRELELTRQAIEIDRQADAVRSGLQVEKLAALRDTQQELQQLREERDRLPVILREERLALLASASLDAEQIRQSALAFDQELQQRLVAAEIEKTSLDARESLVSTQEQRVRIRTQRLNDEVQSRIEEDRKAQVAARDEQERDIEDLQRQVDSLESELRKLRRTYSNVDGDPLQWRDQALRLKEELDQRNEALKQLRMHLEAGDPAHLKRQVDELQDRLVQKQQAISALETQQHQWELGVFERQRWEQTKRVMESGNRLLDERVLQLQSQVNDLTNQQKSASIFPELTRMDRELTIPAHTDAVPDLRNLSKDLKSRMSHAGDGDPLRFRDEEIQLFIGGLAMSQLHILQGISGTGKTSLATAFAKAVGAELTVIAVQAGWRDRADLLGHFNAFERKFYELKTLQAIYRAQTEQDRDRLHVVLLDEMNLSRPEQYFADFLSALEGEGEARDIRLIDNIIENAPKSLVKGRDVTLPRNVWFIGTANQDETTNAFADKTHDRAFVLDVPRPDPGIPAAPRPKSSKVWSISSLMKTFGDAQEVHRDTMQSRIDTLNQSEFARILERELEVGWGSRLERQWKRFVPVVMEAGGTEALAVDHLLRSRLIRDGKVTGRHDVTQDQLSMVRSGLEDLWNKWGFEARPQRCLDALNRNERQMGRG